MIQKQTFPDGGFVLHKIEGDFRGKCSAWYDKEGNLLDTEHIITSWKSRRVKKGAAMWQMLAQKGLTEKDN